MLAFSGFIYYLFFYNPPIL